MGLGLEHVEESGLVETRTKLKVLRIDRKNKPIKIDGLNLTRMYFKCKLESHIE